MGLLTGIYGARIREPLIGSGLVVAGRTGNDGHFMGMLFQIWAHIVPLIQMIQPSSTHGVG